MLNAESRKYFNRVFAMSSSALSAYAVWKVSQFEQIQECSQIYEMDKLIEYLKTASSSVLLECYTLNMGSDNRKFFCCWCIHDQDTSRTLQLK